jgi:hypothetical protein
MKKKIFCFVLALLMLMGTLPLSVFAAAIEEVAGASRDSTGPVVRVTSSLHFYDDGRPEEFRALPDAEGLFTFDIFVAEGERPKNGKEIVVEGHTFGKILNKETGTSGFGYDCLFESDDLKKSFGEATAEEKNAVSHRFRGLTELKAKLNRE